MRLDLKHPLGWIFKSIDVGFDYSDRKKVKSALVYFAYLNGNGCSTSNAPSCATNPYNNTLYAPINSALLYPPTSLAYVGVPGVVNYNVQGALASQFYLVQNMGTNDYNRNYFVEEKVPLGYVKLGHRYAHGRCRGARQSGACNSCTQISPRPPRSPIPRRGSRTDRSPPEPRITRCCRA